MVSVMRKTNVISRCEAIYRTENSSDGLPGIYHSYVLAICKQPGMSQDWLAKHLCINKSSVTRHLSYLEQRGYVERKTSTQDKRELLVYPTEKMLSARSEVAEITRRWNALVASGITEQELEAFHSVLDKMLSKATDIIYGDGVTR